MSIGEQIRDAILGLRKFNTHSDFGDPVTVPLTPDVAAYAERAADTRIWEQFLGGTGTITTPGGEALLATGGGIGSFATLRTLKRVRYQPGYGAIMRFAGRFPSGGVALSTQQYGPQTAEDGLFIGYDGVDFGVFHRHERALEIQTLTISVGAGGVESGTVTLAGTPHAVALTATPPGIPAANHTAAEIAIQGPYADSGATYNAFNVDDTVVFIRQLHGDPPAGANSFSSTGVAAGTFAQTQDGADGTQRFAPLGKDVGPLRSLDPLNGRGVSKITLDPTLGNVYALGFGWLGYAGATFMVKDPDSARFWPFHRLEWANTSVATTTSLRDPRMPVGGVVASLGTAVDVQMAMGSVLGGVAGQILDGPRWEREVDTIGIGVVEVTVCGIQNAAVLNDKINRRRLTISSVIVANTGTKRATFRFRVDPTVVIAHWSQADVNSIVLTDETQDTVTGGNVIGALQVAAGGSERFIFDPPLELERTQSMFVSGQTPSATTDATVIILGNEDP